MHEITKILHSTAWRYVFSSNVNTKQGIYSKNCYYILWHGVLSCNRKVNLMLLKYQGILLAHRIENEYEVTKNLVLFFFPLSFCSLLWYKIYLHLHMVSLLVVICLPAAVVAVCIFILVQRGQGNNLSSPAFKARVLMGSLIVQA